MNFHVRSFVSLLVLFLALLPASVNAKPDKPFPDVIPLGAGFQPEGITEGNESVAYVGALNGGKIFEIDCVQERLPNCAGQRPNCRWPQLRPRSNLLFVAGGLGGKLTYMT